MEQFYGMAPFYGMCVPGLTIWKYNS